MSAVSTKYTSLNEVGRMPFVWCIHICVNPPPLHQIGVCHVLPKAQALVKMVLVSFRFDYFPIYFIQNSSLPGYLESLKKKKAQPTSPLKATSFIILIISKAYIIDVVHFNMLIYTHKDNVIMK